MALAPQQSDQISLRAQGRVARRQAFSRLSRYVLLLATVTGIGVLAVLAVDTMVRGLPVLDWQFITSYPSRNAVDAGLRSSLLGTVWVMGTTIILAIPVAIGTAVFLEEFAPKGRFTSVVRLNIANLAGVPSIIYGILGLTVFVRGVELQGVTLFPALGTTILAGSLTLALMILPMTVIASVEAIRQVPAMKYALAVAGILAVLALSDAPLYPAPVVFQLQDFTQVQASVFQVARAQAFGLGGQQRV